MVISLFTLTMIFNAFALMTNVKDNIVEALKNSSENKEMLMRKYLK